MYSERQGSFDGSRLTLDFEKREARLHTRLHTWPNGDSYSDHTVSVWWAQALAYAYVVFRERARHGLILKRDAEKRAREEAALEAAYPKLVGAPHSLTFFDRLLGDEE